MTVASNNLDTFLLEYRTQGVGPQLYALISDVVRDTATRYPAQVYSPNSTWDEDALAGVTHDFTIDKLLRLGWLEHHLLAADSVTVLRRLITRDFRHFLINKRMRTEYTNLFGRVRRLLGDDARFSACVPAPTPSAIQWGLSPWVRPTEKGVAERLEEVVTAMFQFELPPLAIYRPDSAKHSHLLSNKDLGALLEHTFTYVDKCISLNTIMDGLRYRLGLLDLDVRSLSEPLRSQDAATEARTLSDVIAGAQNVDSRLEVDEVAQDLYDMLSDRQRQVLAAFSSLENPTLEQVGEIVGVSKSTISNELKIIAERLGGQDLSQEDGQGVLASLSALCKRDLGER